MSRQSDRGRGSDVSRGEDMKHGERNGQAPAASPFTELNARSREIFRLIVDGYVQTGSSLQAVYPHRRHLAGKVRALIDHLVAWFEKHPF